MLSLRKPTAERIRRLRQHEANQPFSYAPVGASSKLEGLTAQPPAGYVLMHTRGTLGCGAATYRAARQGLECWAQFDLPWLRLWPSTASIATGETVVVTARVAGLWWSNACRIVYTVDEPAQSDRACQRFGFAYGTLPSHAEAGEERFAVEWNRQDDRVWYDILSFSRPRHPLARAAYSYTRAMQRRFARDSVAAMQRWVEAHAPQSSG